MRRIFLLMCMIVASSCHAVVAVDRPGPAVSADPAADVIAQTDGIKIYRALSRRGSPVIVITNLDPDGARLIDDRDAPSPEAAPRSTAPPGGAVAAASCGNPTGEAAAERRALEPTPSVRVVVNRADGGTDEGGVEVTSDSPGGTTVVININNPPPPAGGAPPVPLIYPVTGIGGLPGPYRYPERLPFLGYGTTVSAPSWFGGLGLNAGNGFGLRTGASCGDGYDCMFGPAAAH